MARSRLCNGTHQAAGCTLRPGILPRDGGGVGGLLPAFQGVELDGHLFCLHVDCHEACRGRAWPARGVRCAWVSAGSRRHPGHLSFMPKLAPCRQVARRGEGLSKTARWCLRGLYDGTSHQAAHPSKARSSPTPPPGWPCCAASCCLPLHAWRAVTWPAC